MHLWRIDTPVADVLLRKLREVLSSEEIERAQQLANPEHRSRFIARRGLLRRILATYLQTDPATLAFDYGPQGKPSLKPMDAAEPALHFNLSHSSDLALLAITRVGPVGVDLEAINPKRDILGIAQRFFHPTEWQTLRDAPTDHQHELFFDLWSCKEAIVKTRGNGIVSGIDAFAIHNASHQPGVRHATTDTPDHQAHVLQSLRLRDQAGKPYVAAVSLMTPDWSLHQPIFNAPL